VKKGIDHLTAYRAFARAVIIVVARLAREQQARAMVQSTTSQCVVFYLRVSSKMQLEGEGLEDQWLTCCRHAERVGWMVVGLYVDPAISGRKDHRPAIDQLKLDVRSRRFKYVLFYRINRMGRNAPAMWATADEVERSGVEVQSATEHFSRHTAAGKLTFNVLASIAQFGSDQLSEVMQTRLAYKAEQGNWVGPVPYGYRRDGKTLAFSDAVAPTAPALCAIAADGTTAAPGSVATAAILVFERYATAVHSDESLAEMLNAEGFRTLNWQSGAWGLFGRESIRTILQNRAYCGYVSSGGVEHRGSHPPLIGEALFQRVQTIRAERTRSGPFKVAPRGGELLTGRIYCADCGSRMYRNQSGRVSSRTVRYRCGGSRAAGARHRDCDAPMALARPVEQHIIDLLCQMRVSPELRAALEDEARAYLAAEPTTTPARDMERALRELKRTFLDDAISAAEYEAQKAALLATPLLTPSPAMLDLETLLAYLADLPTVLRAATRDEARAIVAPVLSHVWIKDRELHAITPTPAFEPLLVGVWKTEVAMGCPTGFGCRIQTSSKRSLCAIHPLPTDSREIWRGTSTWVCCVGWVGICPFSYAHCP
jgi:site-specific DNA recombinase